MVLTTFFGLLWIGEITQSQHNIKNVDINFYMCHKQGNAKTLVILYFASSKTDQTGVRKQWTWVTGESNRTLCPIQALMYYLARRPHNVDYFFVGAHGHPITRKQFIKMLNLGTELAIGKNKHYSSHSLWIGGAVHLYLSGWSLKQIKNKGRWHSDSTAEWYCKRHWMWHIFAEGLVWLASDSIYWAQKMFQHMSHQWPMAQLYKDMKESKL